MTKYLTFILFLLGGFGVGKSYAQTIRRVKADATGANNGSSWANAYTDLQNALTVAVAGDEIWVAAGTYKPSAYPTGCTSCNSIRDYTFFLKDGVKMYGSFVGTENSLSQRTIKLNRTILSGDIGTINSSSDNCYHVVLAAAPLSGGIGVTVDGFSVMKGYGDDNNSNSITVNGNVIYRYNGSGISMFLGKNTLNNNAIFNNVGSGKGGGVYIDSDTNRLTNNIISYNASFKSTSFVDLGCSYGGGVYLSGVNILIYNYITDNQSKGFGLRTYYGDSYGGGAYLSGTNILFYNEISNNSSQGDGGDAGGLYIGDGISYGGGAYLSGINTLYGNIITDNSNIGYGTTYAGGIYLLGTNTLTDNTISNNLSRAYDFGTNFAFNSGGGAYVSGTNILTNNTIRNNSSIGAGFGFGDGGGVYLSGINKLTANTISKNSCNGHGGGIFSIKDSDSTYTNLYRNIVDSNTTQAAEGGGICVYPNGGGNLLLVNNIISNNSSYGSSGGGIYTKAKKTELYNNVFYNNINSSIAGAIRVNSDTSRFRNNIFWANKVTNNLNGIYDDIYNSNSSAVFTITHCLTQANSIYSTGTGIINNQNPLFVNPAIGDFRLQVGSPCLNTGTTLDAPPTDILGITRPQGGGVDMGAYEKQVVDLPVEMLDFIGLLTANGNLLKWTTLSEKDNLGFDIEKSVDGKIFEKIGFVAGNSTTTTRQNYEFLDKKATNLITYYRLKQINFKTNFEYSKIISLSNPNFTPHIIIYPNPVSNILTVETDMKGDYQVINLLGQEVLNCKTPLVDVSTLPRGTYFLKVGTEHVQFIKE